MLSSKIIKFYSPISGNGIKCVENIKKGELIMVFQGRKITTEEANQLYTNGFDYMLQIDHNHFLYLEEDTKYVNHSCEPNGAFLNQSGHLVALRDITQGEEITFDYSANEDTDFSMNCGCGTPSCRKKILPFHQNEPEVQERLLDKATPYLKVDSKE